MAVTMAVVRRTKLANLRQVIVDITGPASYTTGGEALTAAQQAFLMPEQSPNILTQDWTKVIVFDAEVSATTVPAFLSCILDRAGAKIWYTTAGAQTANATNLSAQVIRARVTYMVGAVG